MFKKKLQVKKIILIVFLTFVIISVSIGFYSNNKKQALQYGGEIATLSISSDGRYVISVDAKNFAILWDVRKRQKIILSRNANMYSAYWIKNTSYFMWQDLNTKIIYVIDVDTNKNISKIKTDFLVYGQAISSDLHYFVASDVNWNIFVYDTQHYYLLARHYDDMPGFYDKLINFTFLSNDKLLTSGMGSAAAEDPKDATGIFLWDLKTLKPIHDYIGNILQTFATISPDGQYVVAVDSNSRQIVWETQTGEKIVNILGGEPVIKYNRDGSITTDENIIPSPKDYVDSDGQPSIRFLSVKFIDATHYLRFNTGTPYAVLYEVTNPKLLKYIPLGRHPLPSVNYYERDQAIDTAPDAHILVMAKENEGGILVYQYDPEKQTLTKIWNGS
jgi:WD40 repeat protein